MLYDMRNCYTNLRKKSKEAKHFEWVQLLYYAHA